MDPYRRVVVGRYTGGSQIVVNLRTWAMLDVARDRLGYRRRLTILQGSYHKTTTASAGTHDGGGAVDLTPYQADRARLSHSWMCSLVSAILSASRRSSIRR
jgi:hypothetical protein